MRRVLFVTHNHSSVQPGGVEVYVEELVQAARSHAAIEPWLVARVPEPPHHNGERFIEAEDPGVLFMLSRETDFDPVFWRAYDSRLHTEDWRGLLQRLRPDVVHFHHCAWLGYEALHETRRTLPDVPIVYTLHDLVPICHHRGQMVRTGSLELCEMASPQRCHECFPAIPAATFDLRRRFLAGTMAQDVDVFLAPSQHVRSRYIDWGIPGERIRYEPNGRILRSAPPEPPDAGRRRRIGFFGQLHPFKGLDVLLDAMRILERGGTPVELRVRGSGLEHQPVAFQDLISELTAATTASVQMGGAYRPDELPALLSAVDWVIVPSISWENSPLVIQEACMHRRPVICSDIGGMAEKVRDQIDGLHFRTGDAPNLAETIAHAVSSPALWDRLHADMRHPHGMEDHLALLEGLYEELLDRPRAAAPVLS